MELDEIRLKDASELTEEESAFLKENRDNLTDEELESYKDILGEEGGEEGEEEEEKKGVTFETEEDFQKAVDKRVQELQEEAKRKEEAGKVENRYFPEDYKPKDWEQFAQDFLGVVRKDREVYSRQQREKMAEIDKKLDEETEDLRKIDSSIPEAGTKERRNFDRALAGIMVDNPEINTITKAYSIYKSENKGDEGGETEEQKRQNLAIKVGGGGGTAEESSKVKYDKFSKRSLDDAEEAALRKFEKLS